MHIKEIRMSRGLKAQEVADYLCCSVSVYSRYEREEREPSIDILRKLSDLFEVPVDYIIGNGTNYSTSATRYDSEIMRAARHADERAKRDALILLESHHIYN